MLPHFVLRGFLAPDEVAALLDFTLAHEAAFAPTGVGRGERGSIEPTIRISAATRELGPFGPLFRSKVLALVPEFVAKLGATPLQDPKIELQLVAHNDGAFYKRHIDTHTATDQTALRVLSAVYYFHREPKAFSGGALRLHAIGNAEQNAFVDVEPAHNTLLVFPSWAPHEVMPISCPSKQFADSRFAINCWVYSKRRPQ